jgi:hypothetical protein
MKYGGGEIATLIYLFERHKASDTAEKHGGSKEVRGKPWEATYLVLEPLKHDNLTHFNRQSTFAGRVNPISRHIVQWVIRMPHGQKIVPKASSMRNSALVVGLDRL